MNGKKILISDKVHPLLSDGLKASGAEIDYHPKMPYEEVQRVVSDYHGIIINSKVICDRSFLDRASHLEFIGRLGSGLDIIDLPYAKEVDTEIISSPEGNANAVGEHALGMLLSLLHNINNSHNDVKELNWNREPNRGEALQGKTLGIIGFGHTGPAFAKKLSGSNVKILAFDKYKKGLERQYDFVQASSLENLLKKSDIVSIHLPLTAETRYMVDDHFLQSCRSGAILVNTSRGGIVNSANLLSHLESGHIGGACLDVLENEKPDTWTIEELKVYQALLDRKDVIITPHIAGWTHQSLEKIAQVLLDKIKTFYV